jgi:thioredoxin-related protein
MDRSTWAAIQQSDLNSNAILGDGGPRPPIHSLLGDNDKHIEWMKNLDQAMKAAQAQHKPLVCIFEEDNCGWCKQFDKELAKPAAMQLGGDAIFVKVHPSSDPEAQALASNLGISAYPTVSILDFNGSNVSERTRLTGFMSADQLASQFNHNTSSSVLV